jgi:hypothetical protein
MPSGAWSIRDTLRTSSADAIRTAHASATSITTRARFQRSSAHAGRGPRSVLEIGGLCPRQHEGGQQPEENGSAADDRDRDAEQAQIHRRLRQARDVHRHRREHDLEEGDGAECAGRGPGERQQQTLDQHLLQQACA